MNAISTIGGLVSDPIYVDEFEQSTDYKNEYSYVTKFETKFKHLELVDVPQMVSDCTDK